MSDLEYQNEQTYFLTFCIEQYKHLKNTNGADVKKMFDNKGVSESHKQLVQLVSTLETKCFSGRNEVYQLEEQC